MPIICFIVIAMSYGLCLGGEMATPERPPVRFADMDVYSRIALMQYEETYDAMSQAEKARVYTQRFARPARKTAQEIAEEKQRALEELHILEGDMAAETQTENPTHTRANPPDLYKKPPPEPEKEEDNSYKLKLTFPGSWKDNVEGMRQEQKLDEGLMESLRYGWKATSK